MSNTYQPYKYTAYDKKWRKEAGKTEKDMCERHPGNVYTKGVNDEYPGCEKGWCCSPYTEDSSQQAKPKPVEKKPRKFKIVKKPIKKPEITPVPKKAIKPLIYEVKSKPLTPQELKYSQLSDKEKMEMIFGKDDDDDDNEELHIEEPETVEIPKFNELFIDNLQKLEIIMKSKGEGFRSRAYKNAKESIIRYSKPIHSVDEVKGLKGIGKTIIEKLTELVKTGKISVIERYADEPEQLFNQIYGIGPKKASELHKTHGITTIQQLQENHHLLNSKQIIGLKYYLDLQLRIPRPEIDEYNKILKTHFESVKNSDSIFNIVGSYRRGADNSGDIDIIIGDPNNDIRVFNQFLDRLIESGIVIETLSRGKFKCLAISRIPNKKPRRIDFLFTNWDELSFSTLYFTGSQTFNIAMRSRALDYGLSMNEHGFTVVDPKKMKKPLPKLFPTEKSIFNYLDLEYKEPPERIDFKSIVHIPFKAKPKFTLKKPTPVSTPTTISPQPAISSPKTMECVPGTSGKITFSGGVLLANEYIDKDGNKAIDPTGWWESEKFDGYRAIWNGKSFISRTGKPYNVPKWFADLMPPSIALDGELWVGHGKFEKCGIFRKKTPIDQEWIDWQVMYNVFDLPSVDKPFEERMKLLEKIVNERCLCTKKLNFPTEIIEIRCPLTLTEHTRVKSTEHLDAIFKEVVSQGGEGVMIRQPGSFYVKNRSSTLLKYKQFFDAECVIVGYKAGTGKYTGMLGSFECKLLKGNTEKMFRVSGMIDTIRSNYRTSHPIGTVITIVYNELTKIGIPRHPRYLRKRDDYGL